MGVPGTGPPPFNPLPSALALVQVRPFGRETGYDRRLDGPRPVLPMKPRDDLAVKPKEQIMTTSNQTARAKPTHRLYVVTGEGKKASWKEIAVAWPHRDGKGFSISCDALPLSGQIVMRAVRERQPKEQSQ